MAKPSNAPGFRELLKEWDQRLYDSGFRDIERELHNEKDITTTNASREFRRQMAPPEIIQAKERYFELVYHHVTKTRFPDPVEWAIMVLYAKGTPQTVIQRVLEIRGHRSKVYTPIYRWLKQWGLK